MFDAFHALANEELAFIQGSKGSTLIHTSSLRNTNATQFAEIWESDEDFDTYFAKRHESSGKDFGWLLAGPTKKECFQTDDWSYGKKMEKIKLRYDQKPLRRKIFVFNTFEPKIRDAFVR